MIDLKNWTAWLIKCFFVGMAITWAIGQTPYGRDDSDEGEWGNRSGMAPRTDSLTGCQYLTTSGGGLTPRVDGHGRHIGCKG